MFPNTCWFIPSKNHLFWRMGKGWSVSASLVSPKNKGPAIGRADQDLRFFEPHQTLQFPVETIHSFVSFFGLPKISQNISRSWSNGLMAKLFTNVYLFFWSISICQWLSKPTFLPSGKLSHNYGKIHHAFFTGKLTISTGPFSIANCWHNQRVPRLVDWNSSNRWPRLVCHLSVRWQLRQLRQLRLRILRRRLCAATDPGTWKKTPAGWIWRADWNI